ncbi:hypothetical protein NKI20_02605 [Mesorhizobium sp. M0830]|uniref:hypothetical protein n=1 Tax=Mesorhizobium sp. M0830 TaxID=2957008 RepID=UPI0033389257
MIAGRVTEAWGNSWRRFYAIGRFPQSRLDVRLQSSRRGAVPSNSSCHVAGRLKWRRAGSSLVGLTMLAGCNPFPVTWQWNQKLTIEVVTPQGVTSGSAVTHVIWQDANAVGNYPSSYSGEATVVEVLPKQYLFALVGEETKYIAMHAFEKEIGFFSVTPTGFSVAAQMRGSHDVPLQYYPSLVTFTDISDPRTVQWVDPKNLSASFGPGVTLKRITLEITNDSVTEGKIEGVLRWLNDPAVMKRPGWSSLPINSRRAIGALLSHFPDLKDSHE